MCPRKSPGGISMKIDIALRLLRGRRKTGPARAPRWDNSPVHRPPVCNIYYHWRDADPKLF
jgi:hypothetical protein